MSTSYPLLKIARETESNYGDVLSYADYVSHLPPQDPTCWQVRALQNLASGTKQRIIRQVRDFQKQRGET